MNYGQLTLLELRTLINRDFLIRVTPDYHTCARMRTFLISLPSLAELIGTHRAEHIACKALRSRKTNPTFRAKGYTIVFHWR